MDKKLTDATSFRQLLSAFLELAEEVEDRRYVKKLTFKAITVLFLDAILNRRKTLGEIAGHLASRPWLQRWLGLEGIDPSCLPRALGKLFTGDLAAIYKALAYRVAEKVGKAPRLHHYGPVAAVDSSILPIGKKRGKWAFVQKGKNQAKMHTALYLTGEDTAYPGRVALSTGIVADVDAEVLAQLVVDPAYTYLFDRGYINYALFSQWIQAGIRFVVRLKSNSKVSILEKRPVAAPLLLDADVEVEVPDTGEALHLRLVEYTFTDQKGKRHRVRALTNRFDLPASDIAALYRYRWKVELFFKAMKSQLNLKKLYDSENDAAVWNLIFLHAIAYLLVELERLSHAPGESFGEWLAAIRPYLDILWAEFLAILHKPPSRTSKGRQIKPKRGRPRIHEEQLKGKRILVS